MEYRNKRAEIVEKKWHKKCRYLEFCRRSDLGHCGVAQS